MYVCMFGKFSLIAMQPTSELKIAGGPPSFRLANRSLRQVQKLFSWRRTFCIRQPYFMRYAEFGNHTHSDGNDTGKLATCRMVLMRCSI